MLHDVARSLSVGGYTFPTREDYLAYDADGGRIDQLDANSIIAIQRDWHMRGQNGCVFAMHAARKLNVRQWMYELHSDKLDVHLIRQTIEAAVDDPGNQILSLIFPAIICSTDLRELVSVAHAMGCYQAREVNPDTGLVALRYPIGDAESWIVGFAPLASLPVTRRAPFAELAIRTKQKSKVLHPDLNDDPSQAHLADVDLNCDPEVLSNLIVKTKARSAKILGGYEAREATEGAKAKITFDLSDQQ
jgi:hypothetical protein